MSSSDTSTPAPDSTPSYVEIGAGGQEPEGFLDRHFKLILVLACALLVGLFGWIIWQWLAQRAEAEAANALNLAADQEELFAVAERYAGKPAAGTALLKAATEQFNAGEAPAAQETLQRFLNEYSEHPLRAQAAMSLAAIQRGEGEIEAALQTIQSLPTENTQGLRVLAAIQQGDLLLAEGKVDEAIGVWAKSMEGDFGEAQYLRSELERRVEVARAGLPETVAELPAKSEGQIEQETLQRRLLEAQNLSVDSSSESLDLSNISLGGEVPQLIELDANADEAGTPQAPSSEANEASGEGVNTEVPSPTVPAVESPNVETPLTDPVVEEASTNLEEAQEAAVPEVP